MLKVLNYGDDHHKRQMILVGKFLKLKSIERIGTSGDSYRLIRNDGDEIILDIAISKTSAERKRYFESKKQAGDNIKKCPYKNREHGYCLSCSARKTAMEKRGRYWGWVKNNHHWLTSLRPAAECDTGR